MRKYQITVVSCFLAFGALVAAPTVSQADSAQTVVAVGDIGYRVGGAQGKTAALTKALKPQAVLTMGDVAYGSNSAATYSDFKNKFLPKWKAILKKYPTYVIPGNHEYGSSDTANGYLQLVNTYSLPKTGTDTWWVKQQGNWTIIGLDSEVLSSGSNSCNGQLNAKGQRQQAFLQSTLAANNGRPTLVMWHRPRFSQGEHGNQTDEGVCQFWDTISADNDVKLVLWGHDHNYERATRGSITTFVVGTGGAKLRSCAPPSAQTQSLICGKGTAKRPNYGVLKLKLATHSFTWEYRQVTTKKKKGRISDKGTVNF